jgi:hypothetical protein
MNDLGLAQSTDEDQPVVPRMPWLTPRRLTLFIIGWLSLFALGSVLIANPFQSEPNAQATPSYANVMYLHGLLIGMVGLMALLALQVMQIKSRHAMLWISVGVVFATVLASVGGIFDRTIPGSEVPMWTQIVGFFALDEILIVLIIALFAARKRVAALGRLPVFAGVAAAVAMLGAALMGHLAGWIMEFGENVPPAVASYRGAVGFGSASDFTAALVGSHSHEMAVGAMALAVTMLAVQFGYARLGGAARVVARFGMGMVSFGVVAMALFYIATGITAWTPPDALSQIGTSPNAIPVDDLLTGVLVMGGGVVVALSFIGTLIRTPLRLAAAWAWVLTFATVVVAGYSIELHTTYFGAGDATAAGASNDGIFTWLHQDVGLFLLPTVLVIMLAAERLVVRQVQRNEIAFTAIAGTTLLFVGGMVWVFIDPALSGTGFLVSTVGVLVTGLAVLGTLWYAGLSRVVRTQHARTLQPPRAHTVH